MNDNVIAEFALKGIESLCELDPVLYEFIDREYLRQTNSLVMVAAPGIADPSVLMCEGGP